MRKNIYKTGIALVASMMILAGCTSSNEVDKNTTANTTKAEVETKTEVETEKESEPATDYKAIYKPVLDELSAHIKNQAPFDEDLAIGIDEVINGYTGNAAAMRVGYVYKDISGDGIPELMIMLVDSQENMKSYGNEILALYTVNDGEPEWVLSGYARSSYSYIKENTLFYQGSASAFSSAFGKYVYNKNADGSIDIDFYFIDADKNSDDAAIIYHNTNGLWDVAVSEVVKDMTREDFNNKMSEYGSGKEILEITSFENY